MRHPWGVVGFAAMVVGLGLSPLPAFAATTVDSDFLFGQVWNAAGSPYVIGDNKTVTVPEGEELRIEAGTEVQFAAATGGASVLNILGKLTVTGTAASPVILQKTADSTGKWAGIQIGSATSKASAKISGAVIRDAVHGVYLLGAPDVVIQNVTVENNQIGLSVMAGTFAFDRIVARNNGVGIESSPSGKVTVTNSLIQGNKNYGLVAQGGGSLVAINCTIDGNSPGVTAYNGGYKQGSVEIVNSILSNNKMAAILDDGDIATPVLARVVNTTFWGNAKNLIHRPGNSNGGTPVTIDATVAPPGTGNAVGDPKYVSATDFHLSASSPCIDSAGAAMAPDHDLDLVSRPREGDGVADTDGSTFDRGAYEFVAATGEGGATGAAGMTGAAGTSGTAGTSGGGAGSTGNAGAPGAGGKTGAGGMVGAAGTGVAGTGVGGTSGGGPGGSGPAGSGGGGAISGSGGSGGAGLGTTGSGGLASTGGAIATGGAPRTGGSSGTGTGGAKTNTGASQGGGGCSCQTMPGDPSTLIVGGCLFGFLALALRQKRRGRRDHSTDSEVANSDAQ